MKHQSSMLNCFSQLSVYTLPTVMVFIIYHSPPFINIHMRYPAENPGSAYDRCMTAETVRVKIHVVYIMGPISINAILA